MYSRCGHLDVVADDLFRQATLTEIENKVCVAQWTVTLVLLPDDVGSVDDLLHIVHQPVVQTLDWPVEDVSDASRVEFVAWRVACQATHPHYVDDDGGTLFGGPRTVLLNRLKEVIGVADAVEFLPETPVPIFFCRL